MDFEVLRLQPTDTVPQGSLGDSEGDCAGGDRLERGLRFGRSSSRGRTSDWVGVLGRLWSVCFFSPHLSLGLTSRSLLVCLPSPEPDAGILNFYSPGSSPLSLSLRSSFLRSLTMFYLCTPSDDTLMAHVDRSELDPHRPLVSISFVSFPLVASLSMALP